MPIYLEPIKLKESDRIYMQGIANESTIAGEDVKRRARILLGLADGKMIKDLAKEFDVRPNTITAIRRRFENAGISSLEDAKRSGRPHVGLSPEEIDNRLDGFIENYLLEHDCQPSARVIADELGGSIQAVRDAMKKRNLLQERQRVWNIAMDPAYPPRSLELCGIYISAEQQVAMIKVVGSQGEHDRGQSNAVITHNRRFALAYKPELQTGCYIQLSKAIKAFTEFASKVSTSSGKNSCVDFIRKVIESSGNNEGSSYHLLACGSQISDTGRNLIANTVLDHCDAVEAWIAKTEHLLCLLCSESNSVELSADIANGIENYLSKAVPNSEPFVWMRLNDEAGTHADNASANNPTSVSVAGASLSQDGASVQNGQANLPPGTIQAQIRIMGDDGQWITCKIQDNIGMKQNEFKLDSPENYLQGLNIIEQSIARTSHEVAKGINQEYLNQLSKKKS
ncbi:MAG: helix-turn-helix domain-containing protein [Succinivibrionaceae bacterium]|nr:helix-turn-helix domain-containing protein [Succinivibrionaceae bacterium]